MRDELSCNWQQAVSFAARAHDGQLRKDGETPYVAHPMRVAMIVRQIFRVDDEVALCAALLHDTIEDTTTDYDDLLEAFGKEVADVVVALTKDPRLVEHDREKAYDHQLAKATWQARVVKLADVYDNYCDTVDDAKRAKVVVKARRAISCAGDDSRVKAAILAVDELIQGGRR